MTDAEEREAVAGLIRQVVAARTMLDAILIQCQMLRDSRASSTSDVDAERMTHSAHGHETPDEALEREPPTFGRARPPRRPETRS